MYPSPWLCSTTTILTLVLYFTPFVCATALYDNVDPRIEYQGSWQMVNTSTADFGGTLAFADENSVAAILEFTGTAVTVYGAMQPVGVWNMQSAYYLDSLLVGGYHPSPQVTADQHGVIFYSSGPLSNGAHTLQIVNTGQQFWFDYIAVETAKPVGPTHTTKQLPTKAAVPTSSSSTLIATSVATSNPGLTTSATLQNTSSNSASALSLPHTTSTTSSGIARLTGRVSAVAPSMAQLPSSATAILSSTESSLAVPSAGSPTTSLPSIASSPISLPSHVPASGTSGGALSAHPHTSLHFTVGTIVGTVVGGLVVLLSILAVFLLVRRRHRRIKARSIIMPFRPAPDEILDPSIFRRPLCEKGHYLNRGVSVEPPLPSPPPGNLLVIMHGDHDGGVWADYHSSMPGASEYTSGSSVHASATARVWNGW
ncbi:hypothetical protein C2E23DRAFT_843580 [Lenzites betulinus]|nr:hypothetical protein C2E23DRAFT_843580 [Lenzites betulinus]